jgi:hypothetical protein
MNRLFSFSTLAVAPVAFACSSSPTPTPGPVVPVEAAVPSVDATAEAAMTPGPGVCPTAPPVTGSPCKFSPSLRCEMDYVPSKNANCSPVALCLDGAWLNKTEACSACPKTKPSEGSACPSFGNIDPSICKYDADACHCKFSYGTNYHEWTCAPRNVDPKCPAVRPRLGSPCDIDRDPQKCQYAGCDDGSDSMVCAKGVWACLSPNVGVLDP